MQEIKVIESDIDNCITSVSIRIEPEHYRITIFDEYNEEVKVRIDHVDLLIKALQTAKDAL